MPEVKSARELARDITFDAPHEDKMVAFIKSDRRAIIEKCKEAITELDDRFVGDCLCFSYALDALDSVLSEIEKEE